MHPTLVSPAPGSVARPALTGVLAGDGTSAVRLMVFLADVPQEPPPQWLGWIAPERRGDQTVVDWHLAGAVEPDRAEAFRAWRSGFLLDRVIGDVATVRSFLDWADRYCDVSVLHRLRLPEAHFLAHEARVAARQMRAAADVCRARADTGVALAVAGHSGVVRGFTGTDESTPAIADGVRRIFATDAGLRLVTPESATTVLGWDRSQVPALLRTPNGSEPIGAELARLLEVLTPDPVVEVRAVTLAKVFAGLFEFVPDVATEAANRQRDLFAHTSFRPWR